jgi:hypothetical protein
MDIEDPSFQHDSRYFDGFDANLFVEDPTEIDFTAIMITLPYDRLIIRNRNGEQWTESAARKIVKRVSTALEEFDKSISFDRWSSLLVVALLPKKRRSPE